MAHVLNQADKIDAWLSEIKSQAFKYIDGGGVVPGYKLVEKRAIRKWVDAEKTALDAKKAFGDIAFDVSLKSPAQMEKLASDAKAWVAKRCQAVSSGLTLVPDHDARESKRNAELDFTPITE
jgi:hypothetical protein